ncbi:hypothetical protein B0H66DRAFT_595860 [Apodospora peruviana]|uniref:Uncharacterized protein n=1 Tax=Apodospora peruviana TaxID=516989 RepID=A0AAE0HSV9_9PEZI|nr:hypothetical protein B0H66DRAFT_595860 [Apodospora peruviana]
MVQLNGGWDPLGLKGFMEMLLLRYVERVGLMVHAASPLEPDAAADGESGGDSRVLTAVVTSSPADNATIASSAAVFRTGDTVGEWPKLKVPRERQWRVSDPGRYACSSSWTIFTRALTQSQTQFQQTSAPGQIQRVLQTGVPRYLPTCIQGHPSVLTLELYPPRQQLPNTLPALLDPSTAKSAPDNKVKEELAKASSPPSAPDGLFPPEAAIDKVDPLMVFDIRRLSPSCQLLPISKSQLACKHARHVEKKASSADEIETLFLSQHQVAQVGWCHGYCVGAVCAVRRTSGTNHEGAGGWPPPHPACACHRTPERLVQGLESFRIRQHWGQTQ